MTKDEALRLALEVLQELEDTNSYWWQEVDEVTTKKIDPAITAIKAALEAKDAPLQSVWNTLPSNKDVEDAMRMKRLQQLSTPPQRTPITDEDIRQANHHMVDGAYDYSFKQGVRWAEKVHGIKWEWEK